VGLRPRSALSRRYIRSREMPKSDRVALVARLDELSHKELPVTSRRGLALLSVALTVSVSVSLIGASIVRSSAPVGSWAWDRGIPGELVQLNSATRAAVDLSDHAIDALTVQSRVRRGRQPVDLSHLSVEQRWTDLLHVHKRRCHNGFRLPRSSPRRSRNLEVHTRWWPRDRRNDELRHRWGRAKRRSTSYGNAREWRDEGVDTKSLAGIRLCR
jgi:hypothetical protein